MTPPTQTACTTLAGPVALITDMENRPVCLVSLAGNPLLGQLVAAAINQQADAARPERSVPDGWVRLPAGERRTFEPAPARKGAGPAGSPWLLTVRGRALQVAAWQPCGVVLPDAVRDVCGHWRHRLSTTAEVLVRFEG